MQKKTHSKTIMLLLLERTSRCWKFGTKIATSAAILKTEADGDEGERRQDGGCARLFWRHAAVPSPKNCGRLASCCTPKMMMMAASSFLLLVVFFFREFCVQNSDNGCLLRVKNKNHVENFRYVVGRWMVFFLVLPFSGGQVSRTWQNHRWLNDDINQKPSRMRTKRQQKM